jgi:hypothetical protein
MEAQSAAVRPENLIHKMSVRSPTAVFLNRWVAPHQRNLSVARMAKLLTCVWFRTMSAVSSPSVFRGNYLNGVQIALLTMDPLLLDIN